MNNQTCDNDDATDEEQGVWHLNRALFYLPLNQADKVRVLSVVTNLLSNKEEQ